MSTPDADSHDAPEARDADSTAPAAVQGNLFAGLPTVAETPTALTAGERFDHLLQQPGLRLERIVSTGQASPPGFWYEQAARLRQFEAEKSVF